MNWLNSMIIDIQKKLWTTDERSLFNQDATATIADYESNRRLNQFQSRLKELDRRILDLQ